MKIPNTVKLVGGTGDAAYVGLRYQDSGSLMVDTHDGTTQRIAVLEVQADGTIVPKQIVLNAASDVLRLRAGVDPVSGLDRIELYADADGVMGGFSPGVARLGHLVLTSVPDSPNERNSFMGYGMLQVCDTDPAEVSSSLTTIGDHGDGSYWIVAKDRGDPPDGRRIVASGDNIGGVQWNASDGTNQFAVAEIRATMVGTVNSSKLPAMLSLYVTPDGSKTLSERMQLDDRGANLWGLRFNSASSPSAISTSQNDYTPTGWAASPFVRINATTTLNITGFAAPASGAEVKYLRFVGSGTVTLVAESASSSAANRISMPANRSVTQNTTICMIYDPTSQRWCVAN